MTNVRRVLERIAQRIERLDTAFDGAHGSWAGRVRLGFAACFLLAAVAMIARTVALGALPGPPALLLLMFAVVLYANRLGRFVRDWSPVVLILAVYLAAYGIVSRLQLPVYYTPQLDADKVIGFGQLPTVELQRWIGAPPLALNVLCVFGYVSHFFFPLLLGFYLWIRRSDGFSQLLYTDIVVSALAAVTQTLIPSAPPWLAAQRGLAPGVHDVLRSALSSVGLSDLAHYKGDPHAYNIVAAFPSIHSAFPVIGMMAAIRYAVPRWLQIAQAVQLVIVWFVIVYSGEHYVIDIVGGVAYAFAASWIVERVRARMREARPVNAAMIESGADGLREPVALP